MKKLAVSLLVAGLAVLLAPVRPDSARRATPAAAEVAAAVAVLDAAQRRHRQRHVGLDHRHRSPTSATAAIRPEGPARSWATPLTSGTDVRAALSPTRDRFARQRHRVQAADDRQPRARPERRVHGDARSCRATDSLERRPARRVPAAGQRATACPTTAARHRLVGGHAAAAGAGRAGRPGAAATGPGRLTVLWPLVDDQPRVVGVRGQPDRAVRRLAGHVAGLRRPAVRPARRRPRRPRRTTRNCCTSLCFAVDPDLLATVNAMAAFGYLVRTGPAAPCPGRAPAAANLWLTHAAGASPTGQCVLVLPYADADLAALAHAGGTSLLQLALSQSTSVTDDLGAGRLTNVAWPADDTLDTTTMTDLAGLGVNTVLLAPGVGHAAGRSRRPCRWPGSPAARRRRWCRSTRWSRRRWRRAPTSRTWTRPRSRRRTGWPR